VRIEDAVMDRPDLIQSAGLEFPEVVSAGIGGYMKLMMASMDRILAKRSRCRVNEAEIRRFVQTWQRCVLRSAKGSGLNKGMIYYRLDRKYQENE